MNQREKKAAWERQTFVEFAHVAGLNVIDGSVESRPEPEPDILCELAGRGQVAFELVNLVDEDLMRTIARAHRGENEAVWFGDQTLALISEKLLRKKYETKHPMELLAYGDDTLFPYSIWFPKYAQRIESVFDHAMEKRSGTPTFQRVWVVNLGRQSTDRPVWLVYPPI